MGFLYPLAFDQKLLSNHPLSFADTTSAKDTKANLLD
jgi:hypothetical protein